MNNRVVWKPKVGCFVLEFCICIAVVPAFYILYFMYEETGFLRGVTSICDFRKATV